MHAYRHLLLSSTLILLLGCGGGNSKPAVEYPSGLKDLQAKGSAPRGEPGKPPDGASKPPAPRDPDPMPRADKNKPLSKEAAAELEKFQGTWILTKHDTGTPAKEPATGKLVITGDKYQFTLNGRSNHGTIRLDPTKSPKEIDAEAGDAAAAAVTRLAGLYELEGDTQRTIFGGEGGPRPTDFTVGPGSGRQLFVFKKETKETKPDEKKDEKKEETKPKDK